MNPRRVQVITAVLVITTAVLVIITAVRATAVQAQAIAAVQVIITAGQAAAVQAQAIAAVLVIITAAHIHRTEALTALLHQSRRQKSLKGSVRNIHQLKKRTMFISAPHP